MAFLPAHCSLWQQDRTPRAGLCLGRMKHIQLCSVGLSQENRLISFQTLMSSISVTSCNKELFGCVQCEGAFSLLCLQPVPAGFIQCPHHSAERSCGYSMINNVNELKVNAFTLQGSQRRAC